MNQKTQSAPKIYSYTDSIDLANYSHSLMGYKNTQACYTQSPAYSIGKEPRRNLQKLYIDKEFQKTLSLGRSSPGPKYTASNVLKAKNPRTTIGTASRTLTNFPHYDYYERFDQYMQINEADKFRRSQQAQTRFGSETRFKDMNDLACPGPKYSINLNQTQTTYPRYTIGRKRTTSFQLNPKTHTPKIVGPGRYLDYSTVYTSQINNEPSYSFTQANRQIIKRDDSLNQTFDISQSIGKQIKSQIKTNPAFSMGKKHKNQNIAYFKDFMSKQVKPVRIQHPQM